MTTKHLKEFADLYGKGFRPYRGAIQGEVYKRLDCRDPEKAYWVCLWPILHCFGCSKRCTPKTAVGFQMMLPEGYELRKYGKFSITPAQMLAAKTFLHADEAAYCLCISRSQVYALAAEGKVIRHLDKPFRVTSESVIKEMKRIDI